ncbi:unnamed protein product, partial [Ectocarpus fasciculatus]
HGSKRVDFTRQRGPRNLGQPLQQKFHEPPTVPKEQKVQNPSSHPGYGHHLRLPRGRPANSPPAPTPDVTTPTPRTKQAAFNISRRNRYERREANLKLRCPRRACLE